MDITSREIARQVREAIDTFADEFNIDAITATIIDRYGLINVDTISEPDFWEIVSENLLDVADPAQDFADDMRAAVVRTPVGQPARITVDNTVTVEAVGMARVRHLPWLGATITITGPTRTLVLDGANVTDWAELWGSVRDVLEEAAIIGETALTQAKALNRRVMKHQEQLARARNLRNGHIRAAYRAGTTKYVIAKQLRLSESLVGRVINSIT